MTAATLVALVAACTGQPPPTVADEYTLTVTVAGNGTGTVTSAPAGIVVTRADGEDAAVFADGDVVTLTAVAGGDSYFAGWSGACTGTGSCTVTMDEDASVTATFSLTNPEIYTLTVTTVGSGSGSVSSVPAGISIGETDASDSAQVEQGTDVTLTATAAAGSLFGGWTGACSGVADTCVVTMSGDLDVTAEFFAEGDVTTGTWTIIQSSDDAEEYTEDVIEAFPAGSVHLDSSDLDLTWDTSGDAGRGLVYVGLRFADIDIPAGSVITSASITFTRHSSAPGSVTLVFEGQAADDPSTFVYGGPDPATAANHDISSRPRTDASVSWSSTAPWDLQETSPDLGTIVQEIVSRPGWQADNAMVFIITSPDSDEDNRRRAESFDTPGGNPPVLTITYHAPTTP